MTAVANWVLTVGPVPEQGMKAHLAQLLISISIKVSSKHQVGRYEAVSYTVKRVETYTLVAL